MYCNKNIDIKLSEYDAFLESPSSGTLNVERSESQTILKYLGAYKPKGLHSGSYFSSIRGRLQLIEDSANYYWVVLRIKRYINKY
jgi:hypothetical protein